MDSADEAAVTLNRLDGNGDSLVVFGNRNQVTANLITDAAGCDGGCGFNITVEGGTGNQVTGRHGRDRRRRQPRGRQRQPGAVRRRDLRLSAWA